MYKLKFVVTLLEPLMLPANDRTETSLNCLDYIPGNKFLGLVAGKLYDEKDANKTLDIFHNGNVQFGNAYLSINGKQSSPIPSVIYKEKGNEISQKTYLYHKLTDAKWDHYANEGIQIKQERMGYFVVDEGKIKYTNASMGVVLKSAYNIERKSSKSEQMYLHHFIESGQKFIFYVRSTEKKYLEEIGALLIGKKNISKSKGAEYGGIEIECDGVIPDSPLRANMDTENGLVVYAQSDLSFINNYGEFTWLPTAEDLGFKNGAINYEKSQVYFDKFHTRNGKRRNHDADRLIIKKGSVFVINGTPEINQEKIEKGVGVFLSEGFGQIILNPDFLKDFETKEIVSVELDIEEKNVTNGNPELLKLLKERQAEKDAEQKLYTEVAKFINDKPFYKGIAASQWGAIRSYINEAKTQGNPSDYLYNKLFHFVNAGSNLNGYLYHGKMGEKWRGNKIGDLKNFVVSTVEDKEVINIDRLLLLSIEMPKHIN